MDKKKLLINKINEFDKNLNGMIFTNITGEDLKFGNNNNNLDSLYQIGSSSKMFTSLSIFLLQERGLLSINNPIGDYLKEDHKKLLFIDDFDYSTVTIKSILNHTSGLGEHLNSGDDEKLLEEVAKKNKVFSLTDIIHMCKVNKVQPFHAPNTVIQYSNLGYILLGKIVEFISNVSYKDFIRENIFKPLNMNDSLFISDNSHDSRILNGGYNGKFAAMTPSLAQSAGEIVSSLEDMKKFLVGLWDGKIVSEKTLDIILESLENNTLKADRTFGYGFYKEKNFIGHAGQTFGFLTKAFYDIKKKQFIIISFNDALASKEMLSLGEILYKK